MRAVLWCIFLFTVLASGIFAQDEMPDYRLRAPSIEEYLATVPEALAEYLAEYPDYYGKVPYQPMVDIVVEELAQNYSGDKLFEQRFDLLANAYSAVRNGVAIDNIGDPFADASPDSSVAIFRAWLRENPVDLAATEEIEFPGYHIDVKQMDFDRDDMPEYVLVFNAWSYNTLLVLQRDASLSEGYRFIETPLPMYYDSMRYFTTLNLIDFVDMNADSTMELVVFAKSVDSNNWRNEYCGRLYVLV